MKFAVFELLKGFLWDFWPPQSAPFYFHDKAKTQFSGYKFGAVLGGEKSPRNPLKSIKNWEICKMALFSHFGTTSTFYMKKRLFGLFVNFSGINLKLVFQFCMYVFTYLGDT